VWHRPPNTADKLLALPKFAAHMEQVHGQLVAFLNRIVAGSVALAFRRSLMPLSRERHAAQSLPLTRVP
jgi:hypothetical protein